VALARQFFAGKIAEVSTSTADAGSSRLRAQRLETIGFSMAF